MGVSLPGMPQRIALSGMLWDIARTGMVELVGPYVSRGLCYAAHGYRPNRHAVARLQPIIDA